ncbi:MAG: replication restart helicase PriA [Planctomycetota bacterium]|jgi:primosomal protein N' (replication factor Y)
MATLFDPDRSVGYARVAVERGVDRYPEGLTYAIPPALDDLALGERVMVPLGRSDVSTAGYVIERCDASGLDPQAIKAIERRDHAAAALPVGLLALGRWISSYYCSPIGITLATMMPAAVKRRVGMVSRTMIDLAVSPAAKKKPPPKQRRVLEVLTALAPGERPVELRRLADLAGLRTTSPIKRLVDRNLLVGTTRSAVEAAWVAQNVDTGVPQALTEKQQAIVTSIGELLGRGFSAHLLFGVTGSGKTEVYIRLIERVVAAGKVALMLVPEIALTPQTGGRLIGRFPDHRVAILHSGLTAAQRHHQWAMAADGTAHIVLGARSAVFAPTLDRRLGLIIVDEEHDGSYKQDQAPRYHGRDVALRRAQMAGCPAVLGSATPALESWHNATVRNTYRLHRLDERVPGLRLPRVQIVDFVEQRKMRRDRRVHLLGPLLENAIGQTLAGDGQVLLLLNRRGYANYIACPDHRCGWLLGCDDCDATMVYHIDRRLPTGGYVRCHHCLAEQRLPERCPACGRRISRFGLGTQRVEAELERKFPQLVEGQTMLRVDSDSMHGARDFHDALGRFGAGRIRLLLGTQMIAKGLDFPMVQLVGVVNADTAINLPDFRATERTYQLVSQVAGRCGRGTEPGRVIVQTFQPQTAAIRLAADHDFEAFAAGELADRRRCNLPPFARMARIVIRDHDHERCRRNAGDLARRLRDRADDSVRVRGPAPCPIARIAGRHRQQIELFAESPGPLQGLLSAARTDGLIRTGTAMVVDVDPIALM